MKEGWLWPRSVVFLKIKHNRLYQGLVLPPTRSFSPAMEPDYAPLFIKPTTSLSWGNHEKLDYLSAACINFLGSHQNVLLKKILFFNLPWNSFSYRLRFHHEIEKEAEIKLEMGVRIKNLLCYHLPCRENLNSPNWKRENKLNTSQCIKHAKNIMFPTPSEIS